MKRIEHFSALGWDTRPVIDALPSSMAAGSVRRLVSGGPFGWLIDARIDEVEGRMALEVIEEDRMSGPTHYRVWEDGTKENLPTERPLIVYPAGCSEQEKSRIEEEHGAYNRAVRRLLEDRGFL